tara:strand:- start:902 stop:1924 length:1023 start_codon:yes stop_codon:yes gene_type:complete
MTQKPCYILGIESSCDDTAASVLNHNKVLSNCITNQEIHNQYGGVVPELASRSHQINIIPVVDQALKKAKVKKTDLKAIAYTKGPGLLGSLLVGNSFAKSMAMGLNIPLIEVNHMQAHILANFIDDEFQETPNFPFIGVNISGGHTQILIVKNYFDMEIIGETLDDAIGEAFDKCGKKIGLDYPSGPIIDKLSTDGDSKRFKFPIPKVKDYNVSYSGCKTSFINFIEKEKSNNAEFIKNNLNDLCSSIQSTLIKIITQKIEMAVNQTKIKTIAIGGGVSANSEIRFYLNEKKKNNGWKVHIPSLEYCTDNGAMIGIVGYLKYKNKSFCDFSSVSNSRLSL